MSIYTRIQGTEAPHLSEHTVLGVIQEFQFGRMTAAQATAALRLDQDGRTGEVAEVTALRDKILAVTNNNASIQRSMRVAEAYMIEKVLSLLAEGHYTVAQAKTALGV